MVWGLSYEQALIFWPVVFLTIGFLGYLWFRSRVQRRARRKLKRQPPWKRYYRRGNDPVDTWDPHLGEIDTGTDVDFDD